MRFLAAALALLVLGVANAHHTPEHQLGYPRFVLGKTHLYDVTINMTSGVPGMHSQVSKAVIQAEMKVYAKTEKEAVIQMHKVHVSDSLSGVESPTEQVHLKLNAELEKELKVPTLVTFENGMIKSYTIRPEETLEAQKIRRTVLRNLEIYLDRQYLEAGAQKYWPITYNLTRSSPVGNYSSHYVVTSSPYPDFPKELNVFNISRSDNFEVIPYIAHKTHHNFAKQGCPEVCKMNHIENRFGAGCPIEHEPYHTPMKRSFVQHHNLRMLSSGDLIIDSVKTKETHVADVYDQNMQVTVSTNLQFTNAVQEQILDPRNQEVRTDLNDISKEIDEQAVQKKCFNRDSRAAMEEVKRLLVQVSEIVMQGSIEGEQSKQVGELLVTLQKAMQELKEGDLRSLQRAIVSYDEMEHASEQDKVKRQIWLDLLPVVGTTDAVHFSVHLILENMNLPNKAISLWESKSILEALPQNIHEPSESTIYQLSRLLDIIKERNTPGYSIFYSAAHMAVARVVRNLCANTTALPEESQESSEGPSRWRHFPSHRAHRQEDREQQQQPKNNMSRQCPKAATKKFIEKLVQKLETTNDNAKRVIYIEALARTGLEEVLPALRPYVYGQPSSHDLSQSYIDYLKTVSIYALHNIVEKAPRAVQQLVVPVFFNTTEPPKVRAAAFGVTIKSQPTLGLLQHIAEQSWNEPSDEVASFVTSSLETLGNSSAPCHQLTAFRIKKILPQIKRVGNEKQRAQNILWDMWDQVRGFGFEKRFEFTPSNESIIPSALYGSIGYNADSLKDYFYQYALNVQGLTSRNLYDAVLKKLGLPTAEDIPKEAEGEIFPQLNIVSRDPDFWRFTMYEKLFYSTSYYYFDAEDTSSGDLLNLMVDQLTHYISRNSEGHLSGHLIKVYLPSSYHVKTVSKALPYPVEFQMKNPLLLSMKVKLQQAVSHQEGQGYELHLNPSVYYSTIYTNDILNLGDCKRVGVYHEKRIAATYPVVLSLSVQRSGKLSFGYKFPELPKKIYTYRAESGTYSGKNQWTPLPPTEDRRTIKTIPSQFVKRGSWGIVGLPRFEGVVKTEDIQFGQEEIPRNAEEAIHQAIKHFLNAGWRQKSIDLFRVPDSAIWVPNSEVKILFNYNRDYVSQSKKTSEEDWSTDFKFEDRLDKHDTAAYSTEGRKVYETMTRSLNHIKDTLEVKVEHRVKSVVHKTLNFNLEYNHTLGGFLHTVHLDASAPIVGPMRFVAMSADYAIGFAQRPNEFKYGSRYGKQKGLALGSIAFSKSLPFQDPSVIAKAVFNYKPLNEVLHMDPPAEPRDFEPETHEQCLKDIKKGKSQSVPCIKAIREKSIYNNLQVHALWLKEMPEYVKNLGEKLDLALKHTYYTHMEITKKSAQQQLEKANAKSLRFEATYINKMTDEPVLDIVLDKPTETVWYSRISAGQMQPISSIESIPETYAAAMTNNSYPATCTLMEKYVRTYDMKTYRMPRDSPACTYVLSTHCTEHKKFAVLAKYNSQSLGTKEIHVYVGKDKIVLLPGRQRQTYKVQFNGDDHSVYPLAPVMLSEKSLITALVNIANDGTIFVEVNARRAGLRVRYNGVNVKVQVDARYKGELCGLCSEFNGEVVREYRGVDRTLYSDAGDFAKSSIIGSCTDKKPVYPVEREDSEQQEQKWEGQEWQHHHEQQSSEEQDARPQQSASSEEDWCLYPFPHPCAPSEKERESQQSGEQLERNSNDEYEPTTKRNVVLNRGSELCFSIKPVPVCENNAQPSRTQSSQVEFHCLPKQDVNARKMVTEAKRRILGELETKVVDHTQSVEVAQMC